MRVVIAGGGFGGVKTALELSKDSRFKITLISDRDHFLYYPALYSTATGHSHFESVISLTSIFENCKNVKVIQDTVKSLDVDRKVLVGKGGQYHYDTLVMALGVVTTYFGIEGLKENSFGIKSKQEVSRLKHHLHNELAADKQLDKNYVIVGAGATGVELASALMDYLGEISKLHQVKRGKIRINLVEAMPQVLPRMSKRTAKLVQARLKQIGIIIRTNQKVEAATDGNITIDGKVVPTETIIWTSGVTNHPFFKSHDHIFALAKNGRVEVDEYMRAAPHVYVIGDNAATPYTGLAQTALYDASYMADQLKRLAGNRAVKKYKPYKPPVVLPVGEKWAIFEWGPLSFGGWPAAALRLAADFIGYTDVLPFGKAIGAMQAQFEREEDCKVCRPSLQTQVSEI